MDDDVIQMFHAVNERIKKLEAALRNEKDEREGLGGRLDADDGEIAAINKALGAWIRGNIGDKLDGIDKSIEATNKRVDTIEKKMKK
jgi:archaellum component FlaC